MLKTSHNAILNQNFVKYLVKVYVYIYWQIVPGNSKIMHRGIFCWKLSCLYITSHQFSKSWEMTCKTLITLDIFRLSPSITFYCVCLLGVGIANDHLWVRNNLNVLFKDNKFISWSKYCWSKCIKIESTYGIALTSNKLVKIGKNLTWYAYRLH